MGKIKAISFDLWDTVIVNDSDEAKRQEQGLPSKDTARRQLLQNLIEQNAPVSRVLVERVFDTSTAAFNMIWHELQVTLPVKKRLELIFKGLDIEIPKDRFDTLTRTFEEMELEFKPELAPGISRAIENLKNHYSLVIVSDTIYTPGRILRKILDHYGLRMQFTSLAFSDEVGRAKPSRMIFDKVCRMVGCRPNELIHIGDREYNDVNGAQAMGAKAILSTVVTQTQADSKADAICNNYDELPMIVDRLSLAD